MVDNNIVAPAAGKTGGCYNTALAGINRGTHACGKVNTVM